MLHMNFGNLKVSSDLKISMHGTVDVASVWLVGKKNQNYGLKFIIHSKQLLVTCPFSNDYLFYKKKNIGRDDGYDWQLWGLGLYLMRIKICWE